MKDRFPRGAARAFLAAAAIGGATLSGCGGSTSNGVSDKSPQQILAASRAAAAHADAVSVNGKMMQHGVTVLALDLRIAPHAAAGSYVYHAGKTEVTVLDHTIYLKARAGVYRRLGITKPVPAGAWIRLPPSAYPAFEVFINPAKLTRALLRTPKGLTKGRTETIDGEPALELQTEGRLYKGAIFVSTRGQPLPLMLERRGLEAGKIVFSKWNQPAAISAPNKVVDP